MQSGQGRFGKSGACSVGIGELAEPMVVDALLNPTASRRSLFRRWREFATE